MCARLPVSLILYIPRGVLPSLQVVCVHTCRVRTVFYEELIQYPREVASELLEWVGLPWEEGVLSFHKAERQVATASVAQVRRPLYNSSVARWRVYEEQLEPLRRALGSTVQVGHSHFC